VARRRTAPPQDRLILDSGAVIALSRHDQRARAFLQRAIERDADVRIPVVVLAETLRGGPRDAAVHGVVNTIGEPAPLGSDVGRRAGAILGRARRSDTIDAIVVAEAALAGGAVVLTGDPGDLSTLAAGESGVVIHTL
jgi:predicted nucleic acid-binding protein